MSLDARERAFMTFGMFLPQGNPISPLCGAHIVEIKGARVNDNDRVIHAPLQIREAISTGAIGLLSSTGHTQRVQHDRVLPLRLALQHRVAFESAIPRAL
ncbi:hypothetical protein HGI47_21475 [Novosphingobium sp. ERN07]|uniref:hypothetical protein n=1 Tax=Novosphingobium sp. ERN07 TaxID=2726187 RepID=UPI0014568051|nr:hypothetical protein [Novosphingobium sp. ERN07]NLR73436.1 hypothetical protein [Novosphingobium sp. ERN07]